MHMSDKPQQIKLLAEAIRGLPKVEKCEWDINWAGQCDLVIYPHKQPGGLFPDVWTGEFKYPLNGLLRQVQGILHLHGASILSKQAPVRVYREGLHSRKTLDHYDRDHYTLRIQFNE